jgi:TolB-like protein
MGETSRVNAGEVRIQLDRILSSRALAGSDQLKRLLRIIVERTVSDQADLLKEYNLGLEVFQRPPDYDPKLDPIVRVQARRLRAKLDEYYAGEGAGDAVVIRVPKGAYVPVFEAKSENGSATRAGGMRRWWIAVAVAGILAAAVLATRLPRSAAAPRDEARSIAVLPLKSFVGDPGRAHLPDQATEVLTTELAKIGGLHVSSRTSASVHRNASTPLPEIARSLGVRWIVEGGLGAEGSRVYLKLRVVDSKTDRKVWADVYDCEVNQLVEVNSRAAAHIAAAVETQLARKQ